MGEKSRTRTRFGAVLFACALGATVLATSACDPVLTAKVPDSYKSYFQIAAKRCPGVLTAHELAAQAYAESHFNATAKSHAGAEGMMQIIPEVWAKYGTDANGDGVANPYTPADSVAAAAKYNCYLNSGISSIRGNKTELRLAAYNAGLGAVQKYDGVPPYKETENYVDKVMRYSDHFSEQFTAPATKA